MNKLQELARHGGGQGGRGDAGELVLGSVRGARLGRWRGRGSYQGRWKLAPDLDDAVDGALGGTAADAVKVGGATLEQADRDAARIDPHGPPVAAHGAAEDTCESVDTDLGTVLPDGAHEDRVDVPTVAGDGTVGGPLLWIFGPPVPGEPVVQSGTQVGMDGSVDWRASRSE